MSPILVYVAIAIALCWITVYWRKRNIAKEKLKWIKEVPGWPLLGNSLEFRDPTKILPNSQKYLEQNNGLFQIAIVTRPLIIASNYNFLEWLLSSTTLLEKSTDYQFLHRWLEDGILITHGSTWKRSRKILTPTFHFSILEEFVTKFDKSTKTLINLLSKEVDKDSIDIQPFMKNYTLDVICETAMGVDIDAQLNPESQYVKAVDAMCSLVIERAFNPLKMNDFVYRFTEDFKKETKYLEYLHSISNSVIEKKKQNLSDRETDKTDEVGRKKRTAFLDLLLKYNDENGQNLSDKFIREQVDTIMFAGHDTTAMALCFILHCLSNHADEQEKAYLEIKEICENADVISYSDLQNLKYLELVIKESLRLYPSVPIYSRRINKEVVYDGDKILPEGVTIAICAYAVNRNPEVFKEPDKFIPERFLDSDIKPFSYLPFSAGPRNCIGQKFAMLEMKATLAKLLLNFEILPAIPEHKLIISAETVLKSKNGFRIRLKRRCLV